MDFAKKNNFIVKHKAGGHFEKDLELFKMHFPGHALNRELSRANSLTYSQLDGQMLNILLEKVSPEEVLANRNSEDIPTSIEEQSVVTDPELPIIPMESENVIIPELETLEATTEEQPVESTSEEPSTPLEEEKPKAKKKPLEEDLEEDKKKEEQNNPNSQQ